MTVSVAQQVSLTCYNIDYCAHSSSDERLIVCVMVLLADQVSVLNLIACFAKIDACGTEHLFMGGNF